MKTIIALACVLFTAGAVLADPYSASKRQAKRDSALNDAEQVRIQREADGTSGTPVTPAAPAPAAAPAAPVDPALQATLNNVAGLQTDFAALSHSAGGQPEKISLLNNLSQAGQGAKASPASVKKLADDLMSAVAGKNKLSVAQQTRLARAVHALFNSAHLSAAQQQALLADVQKILTDGGASLDAAVNVVTDLKAVAAETK